MYIFRELPSKTVQNYVNFQFYMVTNKIGRLTLVIFAAQTQAYRIHGIHCASHTFFAYVDSSHTNKIHIDKYKVEI